MPRVSAETLKKLNAFLDTLPPETFHQCALCRDSLTHISKTAEAQTGAGTKTVADAIAERHNDGRPENDHVSGNALKDRVLRHEGVKKAKRSNKTKPSKPKSYDPNANPIDRTISEEFQSAFDLMLRAIRNEKATDWKTTSKEYAVRLIEVLMDAATI